MGDIIGRDKNVQHGDKSKMKIDNRVSAEEGWIKPIVIAVIAGVIVLIINYFFN